MSAWGAVIMGFFGAVFASVTMYCQWDIHGAALALPFLGFALIGFAAARIIRMPGIGIVPSKTVERAIMWSSIGEGVGIFLAINIVDNLHHAEWVLPAIALVVGLHFLPIAFAASSRPFWVLGTVLILSAILGFILPAPRGGELAGIAAAASLWIASAMALRRDWPMKRASLLTA